MKTRIDLLCVAVGWLFLTGSLAAQVAESEQAALTPQAAFERLLAGHERFLQGQPRLRDLPAAVAASAPGQYPAAMFVGCIDSRAAPELIFDQGMGEIFCGRVAGNFVDDEMLGSIEFATKVAGAPLVVVLGHTNCGAIKGACDGVKLGHLTATLDALSPAVHAVPPDGTLRTSANARFIQLVTAANVRVTVQRLRERSDTLAPLIAQGKLGVIGGVYDLATGRIEWLADSAVNVRPAGK